MLRFLLIVLLAVLPLPASAQDAAPSPLEGSWALRVDGAAMFRFDLKRAGDGWTAEWWRPQSFASDGNSFSRVSGPAVAVTGGGGTASGEWVEVTFPDARPGAVPDVFRFRVIGSDRVEMIYVDTKLAPFTLVRVRAGAPLGPWDAGHVYRRVSVESLGLPPDTQLLGPSAGGAPASEPRPDPGADTYTLPPGAKPVEGR